VRIYIMGESRWIEMESWPPPSRKTTYFLDGVACLLPILRKTQLKTILFMIQPIPRLLWEAH